MSEQARAWVTLIPSAKGFASKVQGEIGPDIEKAGKQGGKQYEKGVSGGIGRVKAAMAGALIGGAAVGLLGGFISDARESAKIGKLTAQVIKTTGQAAHVTADQVGDLATSISNKTGVDDEAVQSASNLLLTFTNVRNEVGKGNDIFNQATQAAVDMATVLGGDARSQSVALGKALNDPIKGITALSRSGVSFTEQQKTQIKTMVKSGDVLGAQKIILAELGKEFGGAARAASDPSQRLAVTMGNLKETIGAGLLPVVDKAAVFLNDKVIPALGTAAKFVKDNSTAFKVLGVTIGVLIGVTAAHAAVMAVQAAGGLAAYAKGTRIVTGLTKAWAAVQWVINAALTANPIGLVVIAIAALVAGLVLAWKHSETFRNVVTGAFKAVGGFVLTIVDGILGGFQAMARGLSHLPFIGDKFKGVADGIGNVRKSIKGMKAELDAMGRNTVRVPIVLDVRSSLGKAQQAAVASKLDRLDRRASGGPVVAGRPYIVGEGGKEELFVPEQNGRIYNQQQILAATAAGAAGPAAVHHHEWTINNPTPETAPQSAANNLRRLAFVLGS